MAKSRDTDFGVGNASTLHSCSHHCERRQHGRPNSTYLTYLRPALGFPSLSPSLILNR